MIMNDRGGGGDGEPSFFSRYQSIFFGLLAPYPLFYIHSLRRLSFSSSRLLRLDVPPFQTSFPFLFGDEKGHQEPQCPQIYVHERSTAGD
jgi:hypothetical protein